MSSAGLTDAGSPNVNPRDALPKGRPSEFRAERRQPKPEDKKSDPAEPKDDPAMAAYIDFMKRRLPNADVNNVAGLYGYTVAEALVVLLKQCKDNLTRENIMAQASNLKNVPLSLLMPGITLNTTPQDFRPIKDGYMLQFDGNDWIVASELLKGT